MLSTVKLPKDFKPMYESTPKTQLEPMAKQVEIDNVNKYFNVTNFQQRYRPHLQLT